MFDQTSRADQRCYDNNVLSNRLIYIFSGLHQREVFLFNDILVITKIHSRKKNTVTYSFRQSYLLAGLSVTTFETQHYPFGIKVTQKWDRKLVLTLNARNEHDRTKVLIIVLIH